MQGVRSVLLSVLSMLAEPNIESGADIEVGGKRGQYQLSFQFMKQCCKLYRDNKPEFERRVRQQVKDLLDVQV